MAGSPAKGEVQVDLQQRILNAMRHGGRVQQALEPDAVEQCTHPGHHAFTELRRKRRRCGLRQPTLDPSVRAIWAVRQRSTPFCACCPSQKRPTLPTAGRATPPALQRPE